MDLATTYMGLELTSPLIAGASPLTHDLDVARRLEEHGAAAIVMHSLFEEQIVREELSLHHHLTAHDDGHAEALTYFPEPASFTLGVGPYLDQLAQLKRAVAVPVIGSLNGTTRGGWIEYARRMQDAGADGIELNLYYLAIDPDEPASAIEQRYLDVLAAVRATVRVPIAVKLSPFFSAPVHMARRFAAAGADAIVIFNRFYQPDIDIDALDVVPALTLSNSSELRLRLRWLAAMFGHVPCALAATGGVHTGRDALKALMAGASAVQMTSVILQQGAQVVRRVRDEMVAWMAEHEYASVRQMIGSMSLARCPDPAGFERANYMKVLQSWRYGITS
jgi:dihydroorotate dehydrogenase (fumarate)